MGLYDKDYQQFSLSDIVYSTTNELLLAFPRDFVLRCRPVPIKSMFYVNNLGFESETHKDITVKDVIYKEYDDYSYKNWVSVVWNRTKLIRTSAQNRRVQRLDRGNQNMRNGDIQVSSFTNCELTCNLTLYSNSLECLQVIQEVLAVNPADTGFDFQFENRTYHARYIPPFDVGSLTLVDRDKMGNLASFNITLCIEYPLVLKIQGAKMIDTINTHISTLSGEVLKTTTITN